MSRSWWSSASLLFSSNSITHKDFLMILSGSTTYMSYVKLKGVSLVLELEVEWYDQSIFGSSSTQAALDFIKRFLRPLTLILFDTSVWPLVWGWATEVNHRWVFFSSHHSLKGIPSNWVLLSQIRKLGVPNRVRIFFHMNFIIFMPVTVANGSASIHLVK